MIWNKMDISNLDHQIRTAAIAWLSQIVQAHGGGSFCVNMIDIGNYLLVE